MIVYRNSNDFFLMNNLDNWIILDEDGNELMTSKPITSGQMIAPVDGWILNFNSTKANHTVHDPRVRVLPCLHPPCHQTGKMCIQIISCDIFDHQNVFGPTGLEEASVPRLAGEELERSEEELLEKLLTDPSVAERTRR